MPQRIKYGYAALMKGRLLAGSSSGIAASAVAGAIITRITAVEVDAGDLLLTHMAKSPRRHCSQTKQCHRANHADTLTCRPCGDVLSNGVDTSRNLVAWHARILQPWPQTFFDKGIAMANTARFDFHAHLSRARL